MLWGTRNYLVQLVESFVYFIYFVYLSFLVYYETLQAENGEGRVRGVRSRFPSLFTSPSGLKRPTPLSSHFSFLLELFQFAKTNPGENCACNYFNLNFAKVYLHKSTKYFEIKMYKYCQQDSINLLKMNFRKYQKLKLSLSGRFITLHKKLSFFPMLSFSYMYSVFWLLKVKMDWKNLYWSFQYEMSFPVSYATYRYSHSLKKRPSLRSTV